MLKRVPAGAPMDWDKLRIFHAAAQAGSFTHAGDVLHMSQSAVSRQVAALEGDLGVPLFHRHARGLILTEQGEELFRAAADVLVKLEAVRSRLTDSAETPSGSLRVTTTVGLGSTWLTPRLHEFTELYPSVNIHIILDDEELDLAMRQADVAIRLRQPTQPDLIQRKLFTVHMHLYAAPAYLKRFGEPKSIEDLDAHRIVTFGIPVPSYLKDLNWLETAGRTSDNPREPAVKINNVLALRNAVASGIGIGMLPNYMVEPDAGLVQVLPEQQVPSFSTYFVYPAELKNSARVHVFRDFLLTKAQSWSF
jgi:DNA-binding transcriptional LysR family regulator